MIKKVCKKEISILFVLYLIVLKYLIKNRESAFTFYLYYLITSFSTQKEIKSQVRSKNIPDNVKKDFGISGKEPINNTKTANLRSGKYYYNARWDDPNLGRFITEDPVRDGPNWYAYVGNDPVNFIDPLGLTASDMTWAADARNLENLAQISIEIDRAIQLADLGAVYGYNENLYGTVIPMSLDQYDCTSAMSAITGTPLISTYELTKPIIRDQYFTDVPAGKEQPGDWILTRYTMPGATDTKGHVQMLLGNNQYADSIPATGPRITTGNPVNEYLSNNEVDLTVDMIIRPRRLSK